MNIIIFLLLCNEEKKICGIFVQFSISTPKNINVHLSYFLNNVQLFFK